MKVKKIGVTKNGYTVCVDLETSHASTHLADTPELLTLVQEALPSIVVDGEYTQYEHDFGRVIGESDLVETEDDDDVVYARRFQRDIYTRFVKNKKAQPSSRITIWLKTTDTDKCELVTAYVGRPVPPFPGDEFETKESKPFWSKHALAWGRQEIVLGTETKECPW